MFLMGKFLLYVTMFGGPNITVGTTKIGLQWWSCQDVYIVPISDVFGHGPELCGNEGTTEELVCFTLIPPCKMTVITTKKELVHGHD